MNPSFRNYTHENFLGYCEVIYSRMRIISVSQKKSIKVEIMRIGIYYFSATGVTDQISRQIASELEKQGHTTNLTNILIPETRNKPIDFSIYDFIFFGFPVFAGRAPKIAEDWITTLEGNHQKCSMFFTYGARDLEWAHQCTYYLLRSASFHVVLSAEFICRHSYNATGWTLAEDRPNQTDLDVAANFALESLSRSESDLFFEFDLSKFAYKDQKERKELKGKWANFYPFRIQESCSMCFLCENECPTGAFNATNGVADRDLCIACMHCVTICPDGVIQTGDTSVIFKRFINFLRLTPKNVSKKSSRILTSYSTK